MQEKSSGTPWDDDCWIAERAIVLQVLRGDHDVRWLLAELQAEIDDLDPKALSDALDGLREEEVVEDWGDDVVASRCAQHLDVLGMIAI